MAFNVSENFSESEMDKSIVKFMGKIVKIIFPNPKNKKIGENEEYFGIICWEVTKKLEGKIQTNYRNELTLKGEYINGLDPDKEYKITAKEVEHPKYGKQYDLIYYNEDIDFSKLSNQKGFLRTFLADSQIEGLYSMYENPLELIANHDIDALMKVSGIGEYRANRIIRDFESKKDLGPVYIELDKIGLTTNFINKMIAHYKSPGKVIEIAKNKPYQMITDIDGVGFYTADKVALKGKFKPYSTERIEAFIVYFLEKQGEAGHSYVTAKELNYNIFDSLGEKEEIIIYYDENDKTKNNLNEAIKNLKKNNIIIIEENNNKSLRRVYLSKYYELERNISYHLRRLMNAQNKFVIEDVDKKIQEAEVKQGFNFTEEQIEGIKIGLESQVCLIAGFAGAGKTSVLTGILSVLKGYSFAQTALSGRASARMQEVTGEEGMTIHRLLEYKPDGGFLYNEKNPINYDIVVLDEVSLCGGEIFLKLIEAIPTGSKFFMLGDPGQLEAIGPLNLADDMLNSKAIPTVKLTKVHRQAQKSGILTTAYDIRNQIQLVDQYDFSGTIVKGELKDMVLEITDDKEKDQKLIINYFDKYYHSDLVQENPMKIQAISPVKERGQCSVFNLNQKIQNLINPATGSQNCIKIKRKIDDNGNDFSFEIRENDKVMCVKNKYNTQATPNPEEKIYTPIYNGWTGIVREITSHYLVISFPLANTAEVYIPVDEAGGYITLGYACTTHKMQGDSAEVVIGVIDYYTPPQMLTKQQVYTMITRAKKLCVLVSQNIALRKAIATNFVSSKRTFLPEFLTSNSRS